MHIPEQRGPVSAALLAILAGQPEGNAAALTDLLALASARQTESADVIEDDDIQLALFCLYELHYGGLDGVDDSWEWNPGLIAVRRILEQPFEKELRREARTAVPEVPQVATGGPVSDGVANVLFALAATDTGPSLSKHVSKKATLGQLREFLIHKSVYQLKEADPHTWAIPRLSGRAKAALVEIQADEYGGGRPDRMHSALFARTMRALELDDRYGAYVDAVPAIALASVNMMSLFGLNRRLRGAIAGHLAIYEMTSSRPNQLYGNGFRRHGFDTAATAYFDEHVEADAVHEQIAGRDLAGGLVEAEPGLLPDVLFGATAAIALDARLTLHIMDAWENGLTSLRTDLAAAA
ncbi:iron-containing redox enzyme family protein [Arthrobacter sp. B6]|uniref:iron-containing redox enzyme family protein n=1 Tax=Arthrobacter sp. B6 TaxID=1570137 RepID=UPI00082FD970|nr:iron-containing redox enzyme family protein [Arthrobacter sp. B6]